MTTTTRALALAASLILLAGCDDKPVNGKHHPKGDTWGKKLHFAPAENPAPPRPREPVRFEHPLPYAGVPGTRVDDADPAVVSGRGDNVEFRVAEKQVGEMLRIALDAGAEIRSVTPYRVSLETIFLSAVQEEARERKGAAPEGVKP